MASITVSDAFTLLEDVNKNISNIGTAQRLRMASMLNRQLRDAIQDVDPARLVKPVTFTVSQGTSTDTLPVDFQDNDGLDYGFYTLDSKGDLDVLLTEVRVNDDITQGFRIEGTDTVEFRNVKTAGSIVLRYIPTITNFTTFDDEFVVDDRWIELVQAGMIHRYAVFDSKGSASDEVGASERFLNLLDDFKVRIRRTPNVFSYKRG